MITEDNRDSGRDPRCFALNGDRQRAAPSAVCFYRVGRPFDGPRFLIQLIHITCDDSLSDACSTVIDHQWAPRSLYVCMRIDASPMCVCYNENRRSQVKAAGLPRLGHSMRCHAACCHAPAMMLFPGTGIRRCVNKHRGLAILR
jgi:hypothetical protein